MTGEHTYIAPNRMFNGVTLIVAQSSARTRRRSRCRSRQGRTGHLSPNRRARASSRAGAGRCGQSQGSSRGWWGASDFSMRIYPSRSIISFGSAGAGSPPMPLPPNCSGSPGLALLPAGRPVGKAANQFERALSPITFLNVGSSGSFLRFEANCLRSFRQSSLISSPIISHSRCRGRAPPVIPAVH